MKICISKIRREYSFPGHVIYTMPYSSNEELIIRITKDQGKRMATYDVTYKLIKDF